LDWPSPGDIGQLYAIDASGPVYDTARAAFRQAWGNEPVDTGVGGSIPFIAELAATKACISVCWNALRRRKHCCCRYSDQRDKSRRNVGDATRIRECGYRS
jgi:hypothetical protein